MNWKMNNQFYKVFTKRVHNLKRLKSGGGKMKRIRKSLAAKLIGLTVGLVFIIVAAVSVISFINASAAIENEVETQLGIELDNVITVMERDQENVEGMLVVLSKLPVVDDVDFSMITDEELQNIGEYLHDYKAANEELIDSMFIANSNGMVLVDSDDGSSVGFNISDRDYFTEASKGTAVWSNVVISKISGELVHVYIMPLETSRGSNGDFIVASVKMAPTLELIKNIKIGESGYGFMVDQDGTFIYHPNEEYILQKTIYDLNIPELTEAAAEMTTGKSNKIYYNYDNKDKLDIFAPFGQFSINVNAVRSEYLQPVAEMQNKILLVGLIMFALGGLFAFGISRYIIQRIKRMNVAMEEIGGGDLTIVLDFDENGDELHQIMGALMKMTANVRNLIKGIHEGTEIVSTSSQQLAASAEESGKSATEVTVSIQQLSCGSDQQANDILKTQHLVDDMKMKLDNASDTSAAMSDEALRVKSIAEDSQKAMQDTILKMNTIKENSLKTSEVINNLNAQSDQINYITSMIASVADQTNLLALNAAIEAARAGEAGRGFAVVAEEIRKLATDSQNSANGIANLISEIQREISDANQFTHLERDSIADGEAAIQEAGRAFEIIIENIDKTAKGAISLRKEIETASGFGDNVKKSVDNITSVMIESGSFIQEVSASTEEQTAVSEEISASSDHLAEIAQRLLEEVAKFKI